MLKTYNSTQTTNQNDEFRIIMMRTNNKFYYQGEKSIHSFVVWTHNVFEMGVPVTTDPLPFSYTLTPQITSPKDYYN